MVACCASIRTSTSARRRRPFRACEITMCTHLLSGRVIGHVAIDRPEECIDTSTTFRSWMAASMTSSSPPFFSSSRIILKRCTAGAAALSSHTEACSVYPACQGQRCAPPRRSPLSAPSKMKYRDTCAWTARWSCSTMRQSPRRRVSEKAGHAGGSTKLRRSARTLSTPIPTCRTTHTRTSTTLSRTTAEVQSRTSAIASSHGVDGCVATPTSFPWKKTSQSAGFCSARACNSVASAAHASGARRWFARMVAKTSQS
mmetsp:Transcript_58775/g.140348  ORF Transcript_58775/g.140348 Transcript_58775/m.140348 type:complete len:257 (+) Transcript_58775:205-975(+)